MTKPRARERNACFATATAWKITSQRVDCLAFPAAVQIIAGTTLSRDECSAVWMDVKTAQQKAQKRVTYLTVRTAGKTAPNMVAYSTGQKAVRTVRRYYRELRDWVQ
jgi:hypothetical protein